MSAALRARVVDGHLVVDGVVSLPEGMEFELVPVQIGQASGPGAKPANDHAPTLLELIACDLADDAFVAMLDRPLDLPRDPAL